MGEEEERLKEQETEKKQIQAEQEAKRVAEAERKREEEERKRAELEEEARKSREGEQRRVAEELKTRQEQLATLTVLAVLTKFTNAMPEDYDQLKALFDRVMQHELLQTGKQQTGLKEEADRVQKHA